MKSKFLSIAVVALMALFLSAQAFACGANMGTKDKDVSSMSDTSNSDQNLAPDRDTANQNQGDYNSTAPLDQPDTDQSGPATIQD